MKNKIEHAAAGLGNTVPPINRPQLAWTDFHTVMVIAHCGSVARACVALGMTHSTLLRKLETIETRMNSRLFERVRGRYTPTVAGHEIVQAAQAFEQIARDAETRVLGHDLHPSGSVRISVAPIVIDYVLPSVLAQFASAFPEVQIELAASREHVSLRRREVDVAIRVADTVPEWLVGRKLVDIQYKVYGRRHGRSRVPLRSIEELVGERRWIGFERDARDLKFDRWLASVVPDECVVMRVDGFSHALMMVRAGLGIAALPGFLEGCLPDLQPLSAPIAELRTPLWLITHPELKSTARVQVVMRALGPALANFVRAAQAESPSA
jgi:DNA-binding transcriptional LysR family regulator